MSVSHKNWNIMTSANLNSEACLRYRTIICKCISPPSVIMNEDIQFLKINLKRAIWLDHIENELKKTDSTSKKWKMSQYFKRIMIMSMTQRSLRLHLVSNYDLNFWHESWPPFHSYAISRGVFSHLTCHGFSQMTAQKNGSPSRLEFSNFEDVFEQIVYDFI
mgnify:CR=1 FL=1